MKAVSPPRLYEDRQLYAPLCAGAAYSISGSVSSLHCTLAGDVGTGRPPSRMAPSASPLASPLARLCCFLLRDASCATRCQCGVVVCNLAVYKRAHVAWHRRTEGDEAAVNAASFLRQEDRERSPAEGREGGEDPWLQDSGFAFVGPISAGGSIICLHLRVSQP